MKDLIAALKLRKKYNDMDFDEFAAKVEEFLGKEISEEDKDKFKFMGLNNIDFLMMHLDN